jgi:hypothetical protein
VTPRNQVGQFRTDYRLQIGPAKVKTLRVGGDPPRVLVLPLLETHTGLKLGVRSLTCDCNAWPC